MCATRAIRSISQMTSLNNPPTLLTIPTETLEAVLPYLNQNDLCQCVLASREWNRTFTPYLWQTLAIHTRKHANRFCKDEAQQALKRNVSLVRELRLVHKSLYDQFLPKMVTVYSEPGVGHRTVYKIGPFSRLHTLELYYIKHTESALDGNIFALVRQNPSLRRLKISVEMGSTMLARLVTEHIPNLEDLDVDIMWRGDVKELLENLPESIRILRMKTVHHRTALPRSAEASKTDDANPMKRKVRLHHALESLDISGTLDRVPEDVVVGFLESCSPRLKRVGGIVYTWSLGNAAVTRALSNIGFVWTELHRYTFPRCDDVNVARIIASTAWTVIDLYTQSLRSMSVNALVENCENLTVLNLMEYGNTAMTGSHMQTILSTAKNLKTFQAHWILDAQKISATDILMSEWATTTLEHIDFKIDVPRVFDEDITDENDQAEALESSRNIQRQLLRRLGQQIHFKKLMIGGMATTGQFGHQRNCVEFTLETGLDELKNLKKLELLDIHHMDHRAGVPELEWMVENWPQINSVSGMLDSLHSPSNEVKDWLANHQPSWT